MSRYRAGSRGRKLHNGLTAREMSEQSGVLISTIQKRYRAGVRGDDLTALSLRSYRSDHDHMRRMAAVSAARRQGMPRAGGHRHIRAMAPEELADYRILVRHCYSMADALTAIGRADLIPENRR